MTNHYRLILLLLFFLVSGCATQSDCNPAIRGNTVNTLGCIFSGQYNQRQLSLEAALEEEKALTESLRQIYALLEIEQRGVAGNLSSTQAQYQQLNRSLNNLISQVSRNSQGNLKLQQKINGLKNKMATVNNSSGNTQKQLALNSLYTEVENLKKELGYN